MVKSRLRNISPRGLNMTASLPVYVAEQSPGQGRTR